MNKKLIKPVIKSMFKQNVANVFIILGIALFILIPMVLVNSSSSVLSTVKENRANVYGEFTDIYYDYASANNGGEISINESYMDKTFSDMVYDKYGVMYIVDQIKTEKDITNIGYADDIAIELGKIKLIEGGLPESKKQIAITESALDRFGSGIGVSDDIEISGQTYTVSGIVADYGRLWPKGKKQIQNGATAIDIFVSKDMAIDKYAATAYVSYIILIDRDVSISSNVEYSDIFYYNTNGKLGEDENLFSVPTEFITIVFVVCTFLLFNILFLAKKRIKEKYYKFWVLGLSRKRCRLFISLEMFVNACLGNILGFLLGCIGTYVAVSVLENRIGITITISYRISLIIIMAIIDTITVIVIGNILFRMNEEKYLHRVGIHKAKRSGIFRIALLEFYRSKKIFITTVIMLAFSISFIYYIDQFNTVFVEETDYEEIGGKMPLNYDYELYTDPVSTAPRSEGDICIANTYERDGATAATLKEVSKLDGIEKVYGYKENNKMYILEETPEFCDYLDMSDGFLDGMYEDYSIGFQLNKVVGYDTDKIISTKVVGYPEEDISEFSQYVVEGSIDMDKLNSGEEIILVAPAFKCTTIECEDGGRESTLEPADYREEGAINDTLYHVGDEISLSELKLLSDTNGGMNEEEVKRDIKRNDFKVRIGAIIRSNIGWFEREVPSVLTYRFMSTNKGLEKYGIDVTYNRIRVYAKADADMAMLTNELSSIIANYPRIAMDNKTNQLKNYRELNYLVSLMCSLLQALVYIVGVVTTITQIISKTQFNKEYYRLYRMNGMHFSDLVYMFFIQIVMILILAVIAVIPISYVMLSSIGINSILSFTKIITSITKMSVMSIYFAIIIISCLICSTISGRKA